MYHRRRLSAALAFDIVLCGALLQGACTPKSPPVLPVIAATPVEVPMPAPPSDASLFGYLKISDVKQTLVKFGGPMVNMVAAERGVALSEIQVGKPAAVFVWDPKGATSPLTVPAVALLPVPPEGSLVAKLKTLAESAKIEPAGDGTLAAMTPEVAERAQAGRAGLLDILHTPLPFEGLLYLNSATILDAYAPAIRGGFRAIEPMMAVAAAQRKDAISPKSSLAMLESILVGFESLRAIAVGAKTYDGGLELSTMVQDKQPSPGGPVSAPDLAQFLPPGDLRVVWNTPDVKRSIEFYLRTYGPMLDEKPAIKTQVLQLVDEWLKASRTMDSATSLQLGGEKGLSGYGLMLVENPAAVLKVADKIIDVFNQGPVHDAYKSLGVDVQIVHKPKARKVKGWAVDRYEYHLTLSPDMPDALAKGVWQKLGQSSYEVARVGPYIAFATNSTLDELVNALFTGKGEHPMKATAVFPPGGRVYLDVNVASLLAGFKSLMPPHLAQRLPTLPASMDLLTVFGYDSGQTGYYKFRVPGMLLTTILGALR